MNSENLPLQWAGEIKDEIIEWRRYMHTIPELGLFTPKTRDFIKGKLDEWGVNYTTYEDNSGIVALLGKGGGKTLAIRADIDALPIKEETQLPYSSKNENMHACGHDCHGAMLLGVAKILKEHEEELNGYVKLFFQPGEEGPGGAPVMIKNGCMENPKVDAILATHVGAISKNGKLGDISLHYGPVTAADDQFDLTIIGRGGHGAAPHNCVDPVVVATTIINVFQTIVSREIDPVEPCVITVATLQAGRGAENIISDTCYMRGTVRNANMRNRNYVLKRMEEVVSGICKAMRADYNWKLDYGYVPVVNDTAMTDSLISSAEKVIGHESIHVEGRQQMGGEDAGFYYQLVPGCFYNIACITKAFDGNEYPPHNSKMTIDDSVLYKGSAIFVQAAIDYLKNN
jgi:amidohydrolase